ncbi:glycosyltransferase N-terminal domain-containing protein, partial [Roseobacter sp.]
MARSLSLAAYLAIARRQPACLEKITTQRPDGELIWLHCADPKRARTLAQLGLRLTVHRPEVQILLTTSPGQRPLQDLPENVLWQECPSENPDDIRVFLNHWRPDLLIWLGQWLRPALIDAAHQRAIASLLLEASTPGLENKNWRWIPEPTQATLHRFSNVLTIDKASADRFRKSLPDNSTLICESGPLMEESPALPCNETDLEELRAALAGRPVWLAARVQPREVHTALAAFRKVLRLAHRMLLIIVPDSSEDAAEIKQAVTESGLRFAE